MSILNSKLYIEDIETVCGLDLPWKELEGKTILITGATGLICSCVADILLWKKRLGLKTYLIFAGRNYEKTITRFNPFIEGKDYTFSYYDAVSGTKPAIGRNVNFIIHGASNAHPAAYSAQPVETMLANLMGTNALLKMVAEQHSDRLLFISSSEVYGQKTDGKPYSEADYGYVDILNPRACYPSSKRAAETLCATYSAEYGVDYVIVRLGHVYGPTMTETDSRAASQFARNAANGEDIVMKSDGQQVRSWCYVVDCATAILTVLLRGISGEAYNVSDSESIASIADFAHAAAAAAEVQVFFGKPTETEKKGYNLMDNSALDGDKLAELGWTSIYGLSEGVARTICVIRSF